MFTPPTDTVNTPSTIGLQQQIESNPSALAALNQYASQGGSNSASPQQTQAFLQAMASAGITIPSSFSVIQTTTDADTGQVGGLVVDPSANTGGLSLGAALALLAIPVVAGVAGMALSGAGGGPAAGGGGAAATTGTIASTTAPAVTGGLTAGSALSAAGPALTIGQLLQGTGQALGSAATAAGNNQRTAGQIAASLTNANTSGEEAYQNEEVNLAKEEAAQRATDLTNVGRANFLLNPNPSPYDVTGGGGGKVAPGSPEAAALTSVQNQGVSALATPPQYATTNIPAPTPYTPLNISQYTTPSALTTGLNIASPALTAGGLLLRYLHGQPASSTTGGSASTTGGAASTTGNLNLDYGSPEGDE